MFHTHGVKPGSGLTDLFFHENYNILTHLHEVKVLFYTSITIPCIRPLFL